MRHPLPTDIGWIDDVLDEWPCTLRWDVKGHTPSAPSLEGRLWDGVATQRVALDDRGEPAGLLQLVDLNLVNGTGRLEAIAPSPTQVAASWSRFVTQVADDFPLRACYVFTVADGLDVRALDAGACEVGRLPAHQLRGLGRYEDVVIYEIRMDPACARVGDPDGTDTLT